MCGVQLSSALQCTWGKTAGFVAREEQGVLDFGLKQRMREGHVVREEAILDVELSLHMSAAPILIIVTIRNPSAEWCLSVAASTEAFVIAEAAKDKQRRYPPRAGRPVTCCAAETYGRTGTDFLAIISHLAKLVGQRQMSRGLLATPWVSIWKCELSALIAKCIAYTLLAGVQLFRSTFCLVDVPSHSSA